VSANVHHAH